MSKGLSPSFLHLFSSRKTFPSRSMYERTQQPFPVEKGASRLPKGQVYSPHVNTKDTNDIPVQCPSVKHPI